MEAKVVGDYIRVSVSVEDVEGFNASWPGSSIEPSAGYFEFHRDTMDLVDCSDNFKGDEHEFFALSCDAQTLASEPRYRFGG